MSLVKELKKKRDIVVFSVVGLLYVIPAANLIWGQTGFMAGLVVFFVGAIVSLIPFKNIKCPYCSQSLLEKTSEKGWKWYWPTVPNICPACTRDLTKPYDAARTPVGNRLGAVVN